MLQDFENWCIQNWDKIVTIFLTVVAIIYAALAYHSSKSSAKFSAAAHSTNLYVNLQSRLQESRRSYRDLLQKCAQATDNWDKFLGKNRLMLKHSDPVEVSKIRNLELQGRSLLAEADELFNRTDRDKPLQIETALSEIIEITDRIEGLARQIQNPPNVFG